MTLTEMSYYSRRLLPLGVIFFLVILIFFYAFRVFFLYLEANKPVQISLNPVFGSLKSLVITGTTVSNARYTLDTIEGQPITATHSAKIFFLPPSTSRFGFREKIYIMAKTMGFNTEAVQHKLNGTVASFSDDRQTFSVDITTFNFIYEYDIKDDETLFLNAVVPSQSLSEERAKEFLRAVGRYPEELAQGKTNTLYYHYNPVEKKLTPVTRVQDANVVEVDFYRPDIDAVPQSISTVSPKYFNSQNFVILAFNAAGSKVIKAQVQFYERSSEQIGIYPLKTGDQAYKELQEGKGIIVSPAQSLQNVAIKKMFIGYYDPDTYQEYLQPVYVFLGDNDFVGYVPAVMETYVAK